MLYQKTGLPPEDELLLCTVTSVQYNSVFCTMDEYDGRTGMIHISEVTAGRIRNIRDYVQEGRKVVCKVLRVDEEKGHVDLSLRRVNERQRREKVTALKQEVKAENLITHIAKELKEDPKKFYAKIATPILSTFEYLHDAFQAVVDDDYSLAETGLDKKIALEVEKLVKERIKPHQVQIEGKFIISTYAENGLQLVSKALVAGRDAAVDAEIRYLGAGQHKIVVTAEEYKDAEKKLKLAIDAVEDSFKKVPTSTVTFERTDQD